MFVSRKIEDGAQKLDEAGYAEGIRQLVKRMDEAGSSTLLTGSVQLVGLSKIREKLGSAWDAIAVKAAAIAEEEIGRRLGEHPPAIALRIASSRESASRSKSRYVTPPAVMSVPSLQRAYKRSACASSVAW